MSFLTHKLSQVHLIGLTVACLAVFVAGCDNSKDEKGQEKKTPTKTDAQTKGDEGQKTAPVATKQTKAPPNPAAIKPTDAKSALSGRDAKKPEMKPISAPGETKTAEKPATDQDTDKRRQQIQDQIFAMMRVQMEKAIKERKDLLEAGKPAHDPEVRRLEGVIMNARRLLTEAGEEVGEVDPPIVQEG